MVERLLSSFKLLGCNMSIKIHFLFSHLDQFPSNLGDYSTGRKVSPGTQGNMEERYKADGMLTWWLICAGASKEINLFKSTVEFPRRKDLYLWMDKNECIFPLYLRLFLIQHLLTHVCLNLIFSENFFWAENAFFKLLGYFFFYDKLF